MCLKQGPELDNETEILLRQVAPDCLKEEGEPSSQTFWPWRSIDEGCLSVDRGSLTTAAKAFERFTGPKPDGFELPGAEVWGLTVGEVRAKALTAWSDPVAAGENTPANPSHAVIDFEAFDLKRRKKIGQQLKVVAMDRGCLYPEKAVAAAGAMPPALPAPVASASDQTEAESRQSDGVAAHEGSPALEVAIAPAATQPSEASAHGSGANN